jgi:pyrimidine-nucleoside phosphorylase
MVDLLEKKKLGQELTKEEIDFWVQGLSRRAIPEYQTSAMLMAIRLKGMTKAETFALTESMMHSGKMLDLSDIPGVKADKHSTGGVGDKTSMALCPMVASLGLKIAKMSGRGLGFTGGTLDKLESIPGMSVTLTPDQFKKQVKDVGMAIIGQSPELDPADKILYALRDVTATVDSVPLIASSIMSKKLAAGCDDILLDVKYGNGAFMPTKEAAENLAKVMVEIGCYFHRNVEAEITNMNEPLGNAIGNILEVKEAIDTLHGHGPKDFTELCFSSGASMLLQAGLYSTRQEARKALEENVQNGKAFEVFRRFVQAQGGDVSYIDHPEKFPTALYVYPVKSTKSGYLTSIDTMAMGLDSMRLGAGREKEDDLIDPTAGIILNKKIGDKVSRGDLLLTLYTEKDDMDGMQTSILKNFDFGDAPVPMNPVVEEIISYDSTNRTFFVTKED